MQIRYERDAQLANLASELTYLQANMLKEQKRLEMVIVEKQAQLDAQAIETERLKKMNKVLNQQMANLQSKSKLMAMLEDRDMDTPSSEDSSPKSSFSTKTTKIEIKPRSLNNELLSPDSSSDMVVTVLPQMSLSSTTSSNLVGGISADNKNANIGSSMRVTPTSSQHQLGQNVTVGILSTSTSSKRDHILPSLSLPVNQDNLGSLGHSPDLLSPSSSPKKPPIPSRAGVNKKLQKSSPTSQPPPPPPRVSSNKRSSSREDKADSGRESDDQNTSRLCLNVNDPSFEYVTGQIINSNNTGDGNNVGRNKGKQVNFLASSSPKRDVNPVTMSGRTTTTTQKNFEEYKNSNEFNKTKTNRQKTYLHPNHNTDEKENKFNNGDRTTDEGFSSSHEDHNQQISLSPSSSQAGYDDYLNYAGLNQKSTGHPSPSSMVVPANKTSTLPSSNISALSNNTINSSNNNNNSNNQIKTMTNHRAVQKPSDIKHRSKLKAPSSISNLSVLEEHQVSGEGQVTTVTYWTEPYL